MKIDYFYSKEWKCWLLLLKDEHGNQVGEAETYFTKKELKQAIKEKEAEGHYSS